MEDNLLLSVYKHLQTKKWTAYKKQFFLIFAQILPGVGPTDSAPGNLSTCVSVLMYQDYIKKYMRIY